MKKTEVIIRNAGFKDAGTIFKLIRQHPRELLPRPISDIVENIDRFLVAEVGRRVIGTVSWQILPEIGLAEQPSVEIKSLSVDGRYHRKGVGRELVLQAISRIMPLYPAQLVVLTFSPGFFGKFGFKEIPKRKIMHKLYMGCVNCAKYDSPFTCPEVAMSLLLKYSGKKSKVLKGE